MFTPAGIINYPINTLLSAFLLCFSGFLCLKGSRSDCCATADKSPMSTRKIIFRHGRLILKLNWINKLNQHSEFSHIWSFQNHFTDLTLLTRMLITLNTRTNYLFEFYCVLIEAGQRGLISISLLKQFRPDSLSSNCRAQSINSIFLIIVFQAAENMKILWKSYALKRRVIYNKQFAFLLPEALSDVCLEMLLFLLSLINGLGGNGNGVKSFYNADY